MGNLRRRCYGMGASLSAIRHHMGRLGCVGAGKVLSDLRFPLVICGRYPRMGLADDGQVPHTAA